MQSDELEIPMNAYFKVTEPFRIYLKRGWCLSNSYIGSSRVCSGIYDAVNAMPGDVIHCLVGGTFVVRASGETAEGRLNPPKPIFEKTYLHRSDAQILKNSSRVAEIEKPSKTIDFADVRKRGDVQFPDVSQEIREIEPSPEMMTLRASAEVAYQAMAMARDEGTVDERGAAPSIREKDHDHDPVVRLRAYCGTYSTFAGRTEMSATFTLEYAYLPKFATLVVPENDRIAGHEPTRTEGGRAHYRMSLEEAAGWFGSLLSDRLAGMAETPKAKL